MAQLSQGFNTLSKTVDTLAAIVAATTGTPSNGSSSSTSPSTPPTPPASTPASPPSTPSSPSPSSSSSPASQFREMLSEAAQSTIGPSKLKIINDKGELLDASVHYKNLKYKVSEPEPPAWQTVNPKGSRELDSSAAPQTGNSNKMVNDIQTAQKVGGRKLHTTALIKAGRPYNKELELRKVVTADLESLITKEGYNQVYMAAWYNGSNFKEFNISSYENNSHLMLQAFWQSLLTKAQGCTVYFHNWAGYDAILSMASLVSLHKSGYSFEPILPQR
jgi:hypothetical protein